MQKLIAFDLDMTLFDHTNFCIPDSSMKAISLLKKAGHKIAIASGRDMHNHHSKMFLEILQPDAVIELNGTKVHVDGKLIYEHCFDKKLFQRLASFCKKHGYAMGMTQGDKDYYYNEEIVTKEDIIRWGESGRNYQNPDLMLEMDLHTLVYIGKEEGVYTLREHFPELNIPFFSSRWGADIIEKGINKSNGLKKLCEYFKIDRENTIAFGDAMNDFENIQFAGIGVAMGNAAPKLKEVADLVTDSIDEDGVWNACKKLELI